MRELFKLGGPKYRINIPRGNGVEESDGMNLVRAEWGNEVYAEGAVCSYHYRRSPDDPCAPLAEAWMGRNGQWFLRIKKRSNCADSNEQHDN
jgi:hypothetical protein